MSCGKRILSVTGKEPPSFQYYSVLAMPPLLVLLLDNMAVGVCVDEGWFSSLAQSEGTLGLGEAAHLLRVGVVYGI